MNHQQLTDDQSLLKYHTAAKIIKKMMSLTMVSPARGDGL